MINHEITTLNLKHQTDENVSSIKQLHQFQDQLGTRIQWVEKKLADYNKKFEAVEIMLEKQPRSTEISIEGNRHTVFIHSNHIVTNIR